VADSRAQRERLVRGFGLLASVGPSGGRVLAFPLTRQFVGLGLVNDPDDGRLTVLEI